MFRDLITLHILSVAILFFCIGLAFFHHVVKECDVPFSVLCDKETKHPCEIPDKQMTEFRILCDPDFKDTLYITHEEAEAKPGKNVRIIHGPFAGITGKLHRARGGYYFIKTLAGVGVMMRISRWYCEVTE